MEERLKDCPFCGNKWHRPRVVSYYNQYSGRMFFIECMECGTTSKHQPTEEYAINSWNKRFDD